jgi:hypothetical protein
MPVSRDLWLTDLFRISGEWAQEASDHGAIPVIRVSHWKVGDEGECVSRFTKCEFNQ